VFQNGPGVVSSHNLCVIKLKNIKREWKRKEDTETNPLTIQSPTTTHGKIPKSLQGKRGKASRKEKKFRKTTTTRSAGGGHSIFNTKKKKVPKKVTQMGQTRTNGDSKIDAGELKESTKGGQPFSESDPIISRKFRRRG